MYIFANDGFMFYITRGRQPMPGYAIANEPWYGRMRQQTAPAVLLWPTAAETAVRQHGQQVFSHVRLIKNISTGKKLGYLKIDLNISVMSDLLTLSESTARAAQVLVIADDGHVIYDNRGRFTSRQIDDLRLVNASHAQGRLSWRDSTYLYAAQRSEQTRWTTWVLIPTESVTIEARQTGLLVLILCLVAVMLIGAIVYVVTQRVTRPLRLMTQAMLRVEQGDLGVRVPAATMGDELGRLSRVFNTMLDSVEHLVTQVYEAQLREKDAQLLALQTQINPHFLFNTLNSIRALSRKQHADAVAAMAESLAEIFRYSMSNWNEPVPLHEELDHVANYVTIQRARFGDRFTFDCAVPPELMDALVVKLSIQPLIENAIAHGLDRRRAGLCIVVSASLQGAQLCLEVADTGFGIDAQTLAQLVESLARPVAAAQLPRADVGIGLVNIDRRIKLLFGEQYGVVIRVTENVGTTVSLHLPYRCGDVVDAPGAQGREYPRGRRRTTGAR
jgi:two-component system sensor histidine kinase YesM